MAGLPFVASCALAMILATSQIPWLHLWLIEDWARPSFLVWQLLSTALCAEPATTVLQNCTNSSSRIEGTVTAGCGIFTIVRGTVTILSMITRSLKAMRIRVGKSTPVTRCRGTKCWQRRSKRDATAELMLEAVSAKLRLTRWSNSEVVMEDMTAGRLAFAQISITRFQYIHS